ncbi:hypothetical protein H8E07_03720 [bacterium]|nr:hypothetical protein [bacterium]
MPVSKKTLRRIVLNTILCPVLLLSSGCRSDNARPLRLDDLTPAEHRFVTRFIVLERARAVALMDRETGEALFDSLAAAWGDSALAQARADQPEDTKRQAALQTLIASILDAEEDSLVLAPEARRLGAPLLDPPEKETPSE